MPPVNVLIKPASSACNMRCQYCFYRDVAEHRETAFEGMLSLENMERIIVAAMDYADGQCTFAFQGGEPTLAGLDFFQQVMVLEQKHAKPGVAIHNAIQTNGLVIDESWAAFLAEHHFLVGLSLDGPAQLHDLNRTDASGKGTFNRVTRAARLFEQFGVDYNILCVVTGRNARSIEQIYRFFRKQNFHYLQFIPCLEPLGQERGREKYHLGVQAYGDFLIRIFDLWFQDLKQGHYVSIRHLDNYLSMLLGERAESCNMTGRCSIQFVVEGDGGVYPCDFYVLDQWRLGTVGEQSFAEMVESDLADRFIRESLYVPEECGACKLYPICRNGCRRDRLGDSLHPLAKNYFCDSYRTFFTQREAQLYQATQLILQLRQGRCP